MYVDIDILQTVPPSNLNRDDTGSPKTAIYGGERRARVSSQAWKKATRDAFRATLDPATLGIRTKKSVEMIAERIAAQAPEFEESAQELAVAVLGTANIKSAPPKNNKAGVPETGSLVFFSALQVNHLASLAITSARTGEEVTKQEAKQAADTDHSIDLALFGRMVAEAPDLNVDASAQVAHAISVHAVDNEFDYFTAVDDRAPEDSAGAGMIGTVEFNSATLYRYATVNIAALATSLGSNVATVAALTEFIRAFALSMPTGKQNTFANRTLPDALIVTLRNRQPLNLSGAFENAVSADANRSRLQVAAERLAAHKQSSENAFDQSPVASFVVRVGDTTAALDKSGDVVEFDELLHRVRALVSEYLGGVS
ncbi:type I-E CRISPR-associated protein Cas7/Cse4/CasC [Rathayibacter toxicus]|nr:type I-E CRISPR-associated protein Cas7/Cse4/CasC [Rathayibacter toxicus]QWL31488.1 type I-E CRISPR-associated protein Cas7/Cse4/CasC [Rathayibacter toxicus]QWL33579.1 type I-E CRISPR-associated protein Cas7/Cse4/CasC [Rathayibacter toxicus]QWL35714.1 type I-E CRISPR-associated protein Cas7/Cse4/CasC [Rathayibacter toxicus]QWL37803.1 type I-E CRISPR-associated protein Cas7/Cse4/CasC [Rathayibacter toxicus]QWL39893.1 type I-E CRISPR-associated protein Cas7/Cse4/CasC [Rathayibacter toxicus]